MRSLLSMLLLLLSLTMRAQTTDALYDEGKKLYDEKKYELALKKLLPAAQKGHKKAQYRVGRCYDKGHGVAEDNAKAFQWYAKAAAQGHAKSQYQLGKCHHPRHRKGKGLSAESGKQQERRRQSACQTEGGCRQWR